MREHHSRLMCAVRLPGKAAEPVALALAGFPPISVQKTGRRTVAFDNGTEFARHYRLHQLGAETFFCGVRSPWQNGGVENRIGRLRRFLPGKTDLSALSDAQLSQLIQADNNTPRKRLCYLTPTEIYSNHLFALEM